MRILISSFLFFFMSACSTSSNYNKVDLAPGLVVSAVGLGTEPARPDLTDDQRMLLSINASKMDAYRSLAEKIYGIQISSSVSIRSLSIENDSFKGKVEGLIRNAEIKEIRPVSDSSYQTTVEVTINPEFRAYVFSQLKGK